VPDRRIEDVSASFSSPPEPNQRLRAVESGPPDRDELMRRVSLGDRDAFTTLYDDLAPQVFGLVRRVVCDPAQSEEVTQEVFVEVWRVAHRFERDRGTATTWVLTIAHRRAVDRVRSEQTQRDRVRALAQAPLVAPADDMASSLDRRVVRDAMHSLTDLQRQSIELAYFRGLTQGQISELLDVPLGTIKTRIRDGLIRLRDALGEGS
jgi:RNA polymerase sigma-70 factor, ECF subfamily